MSTFWKNTVKKFKNFSATQILRESTHFNHFCVSKICQYKFRRKSEWQKNTRIFTLWRRTSRQRNTIFFTFSFPLVRWNNGKKKNVRFELSRNIRYYNFSQGTGIYFSLTNSFKNVKYILLKNIRKKSKSKK